MRILIVEDDPTGSSPARRLASHGFDTILVAGVEADVDQALTHPLDLAVVDLDTCSRHAVDRLAADRRDLPLIVTSGPGVADDPIGGLGRRTVDHLVKPFGFEELLARVRLRLQRTAVAPGIPDRPAAVRLDPRRRTAVVDGAEVRLSDREFDLLEVLTRHRGQVLSRQLLLSQVWGYDFDPGSNVVDVYIGYLRKKLGEEIVSTVRGAGYRVD
ncbi:MAG: response regulator transcription factor [Aeromicrobium sp.]|uniref:response regulator transcription factor n=1 Tax=Aeromicrobium sp. TaxID=1871063 RepID=UPI0039E38586